MKNIFDIVCCIAGRTEDVFACLKEFGITFNSFRDAERLASLYNDYHKTVRMPCSLGYTPEKLHDMYPPSGHEQSIPRAKYPSGAEKGKLDIEIFHSQLLTMKMPNGSVRVRILKKLAEIQLSTGTATANEKSAAIPLTHVVAVRNKKGAAENDRSTLMTERIFE